MIPTLVLDGRPMSFHHPSQLASALGLPMPASQRSTQLAWELMPLMEVWLAHLEVIGWHVMLKPTPARGRNLIDMTVNVHQPIAHAVAAWDSHTFDWGMSEDDEAIVATMQKPRDVRAYAASVAAQWTAFLSTHGDELQQTDPTITSPRGAMSFADLLSFLRFHAAFHYRQQRTFLASEGVVLPNAFSIDLLRDLDLPEAVY